VRQLRHIWVIVRFDPLAAEPQAAVSVTKAYGDRTDAELEVARLDSLPDKPARLTYLAQVARWQGSEMLGDAEGDPESDG